MSDYSTTAQVNLQINGQQPQQTLTQLRTRAYELQNALAKAAMAGDKVELRKLRSSLRDTNAQIRKFEDDASKVVNVIRRLDSASVSQLNKALSKLKKELGDIERGTPAWDAHVAKIRLLQGELAKTNAILKSLDPWYVRMNKRLNDWQTTLLGVGAALTGLVMAGRKAVNLFASMEEQLANTRKYTGMTAADVLELNDAFRKMDTRTGRDKLNELAQEAGRLGKNTLESVQGYVEAADIINVALVDLGEGATQTIAKLTNIFGVEEMLGTKEAMLAVGSTVNVLSQNCTASKPYLVDFAQRMAGIGAQAKMSIPQILALGATLDANGQKVEMSASAIGKLLMKLFQEPGEVAKQVGLDVSAFNDALKKSSNDGLMMFLERIHQLGAKEGLAVLAPLFKDLGMDGVRMSQVLSTLAEHIDMVRWEQEEANKAFAEASSAGHEYAIFNNTVQAGIDKAKKRISELGIELGEKLLPVMKHIMTSTSATLRFLNIVVDFVIEYKGALVSLVATLVAYTVAVKASDVALRAHYSVLVLCRGAVGLLDKAVLLSKIAWFGLIGQINKARNAMLAWNLLMKTSPWGWIAAAVTAVVAGIVLLVRRMNELSAVEKTMQEIRSVGAANAQEEIDRVRMLASAARDETLSLKERQRAVEKLNAMIPDYNGHLDATTGKYRENKKALDAYLTSLVRKYEVEGAKDQLKSVGKKVAELRVKRVYAVEELNAAKKDYEFATNMNQTSPAIQTSFGAVIPAGVNGQAAASMTMHSKRGQISDIDKDIAEQLAIKDRIMKAYGKEIRSDVVRSSGATGLELGDDNVSPIGGDSGKTKKEDKFAAEKAWKEREEALNRIAYATGQKNYADYVSRMDAISTEFYKKQLEHTDLSADERLSIEASYYEARVKEGQTYDKLSLEEETRRYDEERMLETQRYADGKVSLATYNETMEEMEIRHLNNVRWIYESGSREREAADKAYFCKMAENQKKHYEDTQKALKEHNEKMAKIKESIFGDNPKERRAKYDSEIHSLIEVRNMELLAAEGNAKERLRIEKAFLEAKKALQKKYNIDGINDAKNVFDQMARDITAWLESDGGKAVMGCADTLVSGMSSIFSGLSSIVQAEMEMQTSAIEKRYEREVSAAEGNGYIIAKLEKQKEKDIAKAKSEANKKMFAMEVMQAVASTALSAINAYSSAAQVPMIGYILAPIAAGMALAAGAIQIAAVKKQQAASLAQGYSEGGFTKPGDVDEVAGVVHAGEWVASQKLLRNPEARPLINALDYAQRTNTIGSLRASDVSRSITAPSVIASAASDGQLSSTLSANAVALASYSGVMKKLVSRLDEPFVTVNTVTGDTGIKKAQDDYDRLMRNKTNMRRR